MTDPELFRPRSGYIFFTLAAIGSLIYTYQSFRYFSFASGITTALWCALILTIGYLIFVRPKVVIYDEGITITNPLYEITRSWADVVTIDVRYTMSIRLQEEIKLPWHRKATETIYAFAAPAPGRYHSRSIHPSDLRGVGISHEAALRPGDSPRSHSGQAAAIARLRQQRFEKQNAATRIERRYSKNTSIQGVILALAVMIGIDVAL
jgi:hypothetical protein